MIRYFLIIFFIIFSASAEVVVTEGTYTFLSNISEDEACSLAKEDAKLKAIEKVLGQTISSDEMENCSEVDGKTSCERNQFFLSSFNGDITRTIPVGKPKIVSQEIVGSDDKASICIVKFQISNSFKHLNSI